jgi:hypothetical protein
MPTRPDTVLSVSSPDNTPKSTSSPLQSSNSLLALIVRMYWLMFGHLVIIIPCRWMMLDQKFHLGWPDVIFLGLIAILIFVRFLDIRLFHGTTADADSRPASMSDFYRYTMKILAGYSAVWLLFRVLL